MAKKAVLLCVVLALIGSVSMFADQSRDEKLKEIDLQIEKYTKQRNWGIGLTIGGFSIELVSLVWALSDPYDPDTFEMNWWPYVGIVGGGIVAAAGVWMWRSGSEAIREWELKRVDVALEVHGPSLASSNKLGEIALVVRY